jgi:hypothetical protein
MQQEQFSTGAAAALLGSIEPKLADLVRRGKVLPPPRVIAGRRLWDCSHVLQAAEHLGLLTDDLRQRLGEDAARVA